MASQSVLHNNQHINTEPFTHTLFLSHTQVDKKWLPDATRCKTPKKKGLGMFELSGHVTLKVGKRAAE